MTDDIEELRRMHDVLTSKLRYHEKNKNLTTIEGIKKNMKIISEKIEEIENNK